jgi:hypothetical protein
LVVLEHGVNGVQQFAHDGDQGLHLEFTLGQEMLIKSAEAGVMPHRHQGRHEKSMTGLAQSEALRFIGDQTKRSMLKRDESLR